jgi:hypothetical protein
LTLKEAKQLLKTIQHQLLQRQVDAFLAISSPCPDCGTPRKVKGYPNRSFRTLFGTFKLASPRRFHCRCKPASRPPNHELGAVFKRWYPDLDVEELPDAA